MSDNVSNVIPTYDSEFKKAISKFSSWGSMCLQLNLYEQILVSTVLDISKYYPNMQVDPNYHATLEHVKTLQGFQSDNPNMEIF